MMLSVMMLRLYSCQIHSTHVTALNDNDVTLCEIGKSRYRQAGHTKAAVTLYSGLIQLSNYILK